MTRETLLYIGLKKVGVGPSSWFPGGSKSSTPERIREGGAWRHNCPHTAKREDSLSKPYTKRQKSLSHIKSLGACWSRAGPSRTGKKQSGASSQGKTAAPYSIGTASSALKPRSIPVGSDALYFSGLGQGHDSINYSMVLGCKIPFTASGGGVITSFNPSMSSTRTLASNDITAVSLCIPFYK